MGKGKNRRIVSGGRNAGKSVYQQICTLEEGIKSALENWILYGFYPGNFTYYMITKQYYEASLIIHDLLKPHFVDHMHSIEEYMRCLPKDARSRHWPGTENLPLSEKAELARIAEMINPQLHKILIKPLNRTRDKL